MARAHYPLCGSDIRRKSLRARDMLYGFLDRYFVPRDGEFNARADHWHCMHDLRKYLHRQLLAALHHLTENRISQEQAEDFLEVLKQDIWYRRFDPHEIRNMALRIDIECQDVWQFLPKEHWGNRHTDIGRSFARQSRCTFITMQMFVHHAQTEMEKKHKELY